MKETEQLRLHPTNSGGERGPMVGRFSSKAVLVIGVSLLAGLMVFILAEAVKCSFTVRLFAASSIPLTTVGILFALARKPAGFARHWLEWQWLKRRGTGLVNPPYVKEEHDAN